MRPGRDERGVERDAAAVRDADQGGLFDADVVEQGEEIAALRERPRRQGRVAVAAHVVAEDGELGRQRLDQLVPHAQVADALVQERDRRTLAGELVVQLGPVDRRALHHSWPPTGCGR